MSKKAKKYSLIILIITFIFTLLFNILLKDKGTYAYLDDEDRVSVKYLYKEKVASGEILYFEVKNNTDYYIWVKDSKLNINPSYSEGYYRQEFTLEMNSDNGNRIIIFPLDKNIYSVFVQDGVKLDRDIYKDSHYSIYIGGELYLIGKDNSVSFKVGNFSEYVKEELNIEEIDMYYD